MPAKLYYLTLSHPSQAARLMLERKGIDHEIKELFPGATRRSCGWPGSAAAPCRA